MAAQIAVRVRNPTKADRTILFSRAIETYAKARREAADMVLIVIKVFATKKEKSIICHGALVLITDKLLQSSYPKEFVVVVIEKLGDVC